MVDLVLLEYSSLCITTFVRKISYFVCLFPVVKYSTIIMQSIFSKIITKKTPCSSPLRAKYGMSFVRSLFDICSAAVIAVLYVILWYIRSRYKGTWLYVLMISAGHYCEEAYVTPVECAAGTYMPYGVVPSTALTGSPTQVGPGQYRPGFHFDGLVQERRNSIANALELRLSCINPSIYYPSFRRLSARKM